VKDVYRSVEREQLQWKTVDRCFATDDDRSCQLWYTT